MVWINTTSTNLKAFCQNNGKAEASPISRYILNTYLLTMCVKLSALYKHYIHNTYIIDRNKGCGREVNIAQGKVKCCTSVETTS